MFAVLFGEFDWHVIVVFQRCNIFKMTFKMAAITGWGITWCLIKVQTFFELMCGKKSAGRIDKIYKKNFWSIVFQHKYKTT